MSFKQFPTPSAHKYNTGYQTFYWLNLKKTDAQLPIFGSDNTYKKVASFLHFLWIQTIILYNTNKRDRDGIKVKKVSYTKYFIII